MSESKAALEHRKWKLEVLKLAEKFNLADEYRQKFLSDTEACA